MQSLVSKQYCERQVVSYDIQAQMLSKSDKYKIKVTRMTFEQIIANHSSGNKMGPIDEKEYN